MKTFPNQCVLFAFLKHLHRSLPLLLATFSTELVKTANHEIKRPVLQSINYNSSSIFLRVFLDLQQTNVCSLLLNDIFVYIFSLVDFWSLKGSFTIFLFLVRSHILNSNGVPGGKIKKQKFWVWGVYRPLQTKSAIPHPITIQNMRSDQK